MRVADAEGSFAMIDLVAHLYRGTSDDRRALATIWTRYSDATEDERRKKGFEIVRMHHATLTRMFRDGTRRERDAISTIHQREKIFGTRRFDGTRGDSTDRR